MSTGEKFHEKDFDSKYSNSVSRKNHNQVHEGGNDEAAFDTHHRVNDSIHNIIEKDNLRKSIARK